MKSWISASRHAWVICSSVVVDGSTPSITLSRMEPAYCKVRCLQSPGG